MLVGDRRDDPPIHFLGPGMVDIARPQPCLDMGNRHFAVIGGERPHHRGRGIALDDHPVGPLAVHHLAKSGQQSRRQPVEALPRLHQIEVDIGHQPGNRQHLIKQPAMLRGHAHAHVEITAAFQRGNNGEQLDRLGAGAENDEDAGFCTHDRHPSAHRLKPT